MTTSLKLTLISLSAATALLACTAASSTDDVDVDVETDQTETACMKGIFCKPPISGGSSGVTSSSSSGMVYDPGPARGAEIPCSGLGPEGAGPMGDLAEYRQIKALGDNASRCWSSYRPYVKEGTLPWGFLTLSLYVCPNKNFPVNRCDVYNRCYCWEY